MAELQLHPIVERVTFLRKHPATGEISVSAVLRNTGRKRKSTRLLRPVDKFLRRLGKAQVQGANVYLERHDRSSRKKKNGWMHDMISNMRKAKGKAWKTLRK